MDLAGSYALSANVDRFLKALMISMMMMMMQSLYNIHSTKSGCFQKSLAHLQKYLFSFQYRKLHAHVCKPGYTSYTSQYV